jgi:Nucleotidyltransferase domain
MAIPEAQLKTWSGQGSITQSKDTYATIKKALEASNTLYADKKYEIFLQGSYGNDTNVYADSDVDIVIKLNSCFFRDLTRLPAEQQAAYKSWFTDAAFGYNDFQIAVTAALKARFADDIQLGAKAIWIKPNGGRRNADVLVALQFRRYHEFHSDSNQRHEEGIGFLSRGNRPRRR